jgi:hypothetical protein
MLRKTDTGKYRFRTRGGGKCEPSKAAKARHAKRFGYSGSKAHKSHHRMLTAKRISRLATIARPARAMIRKMGGMRYMK